MQYSLLVSRVRGFFSQLIRVLRENFKDARLVSVPVAFLWALTYVGVFFMDMTIQACKNDHYNLIHIVKMLCQSKKKSERELRRIMIIFVA